MGEQIDEVDGLELVSERRLASRPDRRFSS